MIFFFGQKREEEVTLLQAFDGVQDNKTKLYLYM